MLGVAHGDTTTSEVTAGDIIFGNATAEWDDLAVGLSGYILRSTGTLPAWSATTSITTLGTIGTGVWQATLVDVVYGGTGAATLTDGGVLLGSGTGAITPMAVLADGEFIVGDGTTDPVAESGNTARTSLGLGTGDSPTFAGGTFNGDVLFDGVAAGLDALWDRSQNELSFADLVVIGIGNGVGAGVRDVTLTWSPSAGGKLLMESNPTGADEDSTWVIGTETKGFDIYWQPTLGVGYLFLNYSDNLVEFHGIGLTVGLSGGDMILGDGSGDFSVASTGIDIDTSGNISNAGTIGSGAITATSLDGPIGGTTPAAGTFTSFSLNDTNTQITEDGSGNMTFKDAVYGTKTLSEMGSPTMVKVTAATVAEGSGATLYHNMASFNDKVLITSIDIDTTSTDYTFKVCPDDDADGVGCITLLSNRSGDFVIHWLYNYEDTDASSEFHYFFESDSGSETHDIDVRGLRCL